MKMAKEDYEFIVTSFSENKDSVISHYNYIKDYENYKVLETRVSWDCLRSFVGNEFILEQYDKGLNDIHITTACVKALNEVLYK